MEVDGGRWNIVDNSYNGYTWLRFPEKTIRESDIYIFQNIKALSGDYRLIEIYIYIYIYKILKIYIF